MTKTTKGTITVPYFRNAQLFYARKAPSESVMTAIVRSVARAVNAEVTLWYDHSETLNRGDGHDAYTAKFFDKRADVYREMPVVV